MSLNLTHLAAFHAVAETGSISRGADRLMVSQPAVSKQVGLLERSLATQLFDRHAKGVTLTSAGETLAEYARRIFGAVTAAEDALTDLAGLRLGKLAIAASTTIGTYLLPEAFVAFRQNYPGVRMTMEIASSAVVARRVAAGEFDVGFIETPCDVPGITVAAQGADELIGVVAPHHPLAASGRATAERFCREPFVVRDTGSETKSFVERALMAKGLMIQPVMSLGSTEAIKRAVSAGIGVAIVSRHSIDLELKARTLAAVRLTNLRIRRPFFEITPANRRNSAALSAFLNAMLEARHESSAASSAKRGLRSK